MADVPVAAPAAPLTTAEFRAAMPAPSLRQRAHDFLALPGSIFYMLLAHSFFSHGLALSALGPALLSLASQTDSDLTAIAFVFTARALGHLGGALLGGAAVDKWVFHQRCCVLVPVFGLALFSMCIPSCPDLNSLLFVIALQGTCSGWIDTASQVLVVRLKASGELGPEGPFLQALHFCFALGALTAPIVFACWMGTAAYTSTSDDITGSGYAAAFYFLTILMLPSIFLLIYQIFWAAETFEVNMDDFIRCITLQPGGMSRHTGHRGETAPIIEHGASDQAPALPLPHPEPSPTPELPYDEPELPVPESPMDFESDSEAPTNERRPSITYDRALGDLVECQSEAGDEPTGVVTSVPSATDAAEVTVGVQHAGPTGGAALFYTGFTAVSGAVVSALPNLSGLGFLLVFAVGILLFIYMGMEAYASYLTTYGASVVGLTPSVAAVLNASFWLAFAFGRAVAIPLARIWSPTRMLTYCLCGCLSLMILLLAGTSSAGWLWVITLLFGAVAGPIYPTVVQWAEQYLTISGKVLRVILVLDAIGAAVLPHLLSWALDQDSSGKWFVVSMIFQCLAATSVFMWLALRIVPRMTGVPELVSWRKAWRHANDQPKVDEADNSTHSPGEWHA